MRFSRRLMLGLFLIGLVLVGLMVRQVGLAGLSDGFHALGLWLLPYLLFNGVLVIFDTCAWAVCFPRQPLPLRGST